MAKLFLALALVALVAQSQAAPRSKKLVTTRIVGGTEAPEGSVPHQVSLRYFGSHICGGSIVNENTVLTAAHCSDYPASSYSVVAGTNDLRPAAGSYQEVDVARVIVYPEYSEFDLSGDLAIFKLSSPLTLSDAAKTKAIVLPPAGHAATGDSTITGWGTTSESGSLPAKLRTVTVPIISDDECNSAYAAYGGTAESMICAGLNAGGKDSCQGDSGGPMLEDGTGYQVGIVSWGVGCARPGYPGVYTEVSYFLDFINQNA